MENLLVRKNVRPSNDHSNKAHWVDASAAGGDESESKKEEPREWENRERRWVDRYFFLPGVQIFLIVDLPADD